MDTNLAGFILSYILVFVILGIATPLVKFNIIPAAIGRKIVHVGVSNWWILAMFFFTDPWWPAIGAVTFIVINYVSYKKRLFRAMEDAVQKKNLGTVYFAVTLLILSILCFGGYYPPYVGAIGVLVMGYGDGFAAIAGTLQGKDSFTIMGNNKTTGGTIAMFLVSFAVIFIILTIYAPQSRFTASLVIASIATLCELFTPFGLDNITVPVISSLSYVLFFL